MLGRSRGLIYGFSAHNFQFATQAAHSMRLPVTIRRIWCLFPNKEYSEKLFDPSRVPRSVRVISGVHEQFASFAIFSSPFDQRKNSSRITFQKPSSSPPILWKASFLIANGPCTMLQFCNTNSSMVELTSGFGNDAYVAFLSPFRTFAFCTGPVFLMWRLQFLLMNRHQEDSEEMFLVVFIS